MITIDNEGPAPSPVRGRGRPARAAGEVEATSARIEAVRASWGLSKARMAVVLNVSSATYAHWASGRAAPHPSTMRLIEVLDSLRIMAPEIYSVTIQGE